MSITFNEVAVNTIANLVAALIIALLGVGTYLLVVISERKKIFRFFGVSGKLPSVRIYVSRLEIKPGGTVGFEPIKAGYHGPSISKIEYEGALLLCRKLSS